MDIKRREVKDMTNIILNGACGKMGTVIAKCVSKRDDCRVVCGVDLYSSDENSFPVVDDFKKVDAGADVIIDFSNPKSLDSMLEYAKENKMPVVICTTGFSKSQVDQIKEASEYLPIFYSGNMSLGINLIIELSKKACNVLGDAFDIEIIEKHHNQKLDAPSGTALMIADALASTMDEAPCYVYDRHSYRKAREKNEIGIHSVRGGTIVGEHEVIFAGHDEVLKISHTAQSKEIFAEGSINAAIFLSQKPNGLYNMSNMIDGK